MSVAAAAILQAALVASLLLLLAPPLGRYLAAVYSDERHLAPERWIYRVAGVDPHADQRWSSYLASLLGFTAAGLVVLFGLLTVQGSLPLSLGFGQMEPAQAVNTAISFVTNTNWQSYSGESALGYLVQMVGLAVQNFVSAAAGMAVAAALIRGLTRQGAAGIGNFWVDLVRGTLRVLLPLAVAVGALLVLGGVVQNVEAPRSIATLSGAEQSLLGGPVASQEAIKELGTNGGGFFNANSAHPLENPNPVTNLIEIVALLLIPFALVAMYGRLVGSRRQAWAIGGVMAAVLLGMVAVTTAVELAHPGTASQLAGGAMEGKEVRFGVPGSTLFASATTGTSTGAVNATHDSFSALSGGALILNMALGEIAPGGVGSGLYGMLVLAMVAVFLSGLMVGRTPELLGKQLGPAQLKLIALYLLVTPTLVLAGTAVALSFGGPREAILNPGPHGLSEVLYAFTSAANNNGSAFAGLGANTTFYNLALGAAMLLGRLLPIALVLALAGSLSAQQRRPDGAGTLPTDTPLFAVLLAGTALIVAGLTYLPALALGPLAEGV